MLKSRLLFKKRWQISRVNNLKTIGIENPQFPSTVLFLNILAQFPHSLSLAHFSMKGLTELKWVKCVP